jgi:hypothetical protein
VVDLLDLIRKAMTGVKTIEPIEKIMVNEKVEISLAQDNPDFGAG